MDLGKSITVEIHKNSYPHGQLRDQHRHFMKGEFMNRRTKRLINQTTRLMNEFFEFKRQLRSEVRDYENR